MSEWDDIFGSKPQKKEEKPVESTTEKPVEDKKEEPPKEESKTEETVEIAKVEAGETVEIGDVVCGGCARSSC